MATVTVRVLSDDPVPVPVEGVLVQFYDTLAVFQTSGTSDVAGEVTVVLPEADYDVLFFKVGVSILPSQPQRIAVEDPGPNEFEVEAHVRSVPESTNPDRCTVSGYILGIGGGRYKTSIVLKLVKSLIVTSGNVIAPQGRLEFFSNDDGYFEFELLRNTRYNAFFVVPRTLFGEDPGCLDVRTPDGPSVDLHSFLFPIPVNMEFSAPTISLVAGADADESIEYTLTYNDGSERTVLATPWGHVSLENSDSDVVGASIQDGVLVLTPYSAGVATITTTRSIPESISYDPLPAYVTGSVVVTVT